MTKKEAIRQAFLRGEHLTPLIALNKYRMLCLSQRVGDLKAEGMDIRDRFVDGQPYKEYWLEVQKPEQLPLGLAA